ncbi:hypothetical protein BAOM_1092 [Peribacillus asahii]|uniref:Uncharacterized protein n=1 Tax=Peribacillus asahii TaxID=228899 RepID=A0A3Q9RKK0_9BACI|nr:hypothetical protein BAOM_1092 [Peribacillus asahii]
MVDTFYLPDFLDSLIHTFKPPVSSTRTLSSIAYSLRTAQ